MIENNEQKLMINVKVIFHYQFLTVCGHKRIVSQ